MLNRNYTISIVARMPLLFNGSLKVGRAVKGSIFSDCRKIVAAIILLCPSLNIYAAQPGDISAKERQSQPAKEADARQDQQAGDERGKTGKKKERGVFIPSDKVSSDIPVSFPADI